MPIMYNAHDGVAPFWNLGLPYGDESLILDKLSGDS
jgi:hypothetical protein